MKRYRLKLLREMRRFTKRFMLAFFLVFSIAMLSLMFLMVHNNIQEARNDVSEILDNLYLVYEENLEFNRNNQNYSGFIKNENGLDQVYQAYYHFNSQNKIKADIVLADIHSNIIFTTKQGNQNTLQLSEKYQQIQKEKLDKMMYTTSILRLSNGETNLVLTTGLYDNKNLVGYVSYFYNSSSFNYALTSKYHKAVIVDKFDNVLASSSDDYLSGRLHRLDNRYQTPGFTQDFEDRLVYVDHEMYKYQIKIVSIINLSGYLTAYGLGFLMLLIFTLIMLILTLRYSNMLVENNATAIEELMRQISIIKGGDLDYRIQLFTDDEFSDLSEDINEMVYAIQAITKHNSELHYINRVSEIKQLEAQLNPHFIYNTLETIRYTIHTDPKIASNLILKLTRILRYSINNEVDEVLFEEELDLANQYLDILKYRYKEQLQVNMNIEEECMQHYVLKFTIQPLIENSIKYGYLHQEKLNIMVCAYFESNYLYIEVHDDGSGIEEEQLEKINQHLKEPYNKTNHNGLFNINRRLYLTYGRESKLLLKSVKGVGTSAIIRIPKKEEM